jgi:bisphosphoglycerate-independent phosphoglycerate mutase (AlkP superfamily)
MNRPARRNSASIVDLAPTILNYFAVPVPENIDGTGLLNNGVIFS